MEKTCSKCNETKPLAAFYFEKARGQHKAACRACIKAAGVVEVRRVCTCCGLNLTLDCFDGRTKAVRGICKECRRAYDRNRRRPKVERPETSHWELPQQDSAPMHLLFQRTRVPVFGGALVAVV